MLPRDLRASFRGWSGMQRDAQEAERRRILVWQCTFYHPRSIPHDFVTSPNPSDIYDGDVDNHYTGTGCTGLI